MSRIFVVLLTLLSSVSAFAQSTFYGDLVMNLTGNTAITPRYVTVEDATIGANLAGVSLLLQGGNASQDGNAIGGHVILRGGASGSGRTDEYKFGGVDIGYQNTRHIWFGGSLEQVTGATIYFKGAIGSAVTFEHPMSTGAAIITKRQPDTGGTAGDLGIIGAKGGNGNSTTAPGRGGPVLVQGGDAGNLNGYGSAYGNSISISPGKGTDSDKNGTIEIGTDPARAPSYVNIGQADMRFSVFGHTAALQQTIAGTTTDDKLASVIALLKAYGWAKP